jgi:hypothetical protein
MTRLLSFSFALVIAACVSPIAYSASQQLFNGKDLSGWEGNPKVWSVEEGAIVGRTTAEAPIDHNTFLIWRAGDVGDFRLKLEYKIEGGNSGIQYRSTVVDPAGWVVAGYQADIDSGETYSGILYEEKERGILCKRGERVTIDKQGKPQAETVADAAQLQSHVRTDDWNEYVIEAIGPRLRHFINGQLMSETVDEADGERAESGVLALQVHQGPPMTVRFRNISLEPIGGEAPADVASVDGQPEVVGTSAAKCCCPMKSHCRRRWLRCR